jgi:putative nucleotidyltransferase with HDIG domain
MTASARVLFIDDDPPVRTAFGRTLRSHNFEFDVADGAASAVKLVEKQGYAVIATDYRMPDIDGLELVNQLQRLQPDATFMLVSGDCDLELAMEAVNGHSVAFVITKPWNAEELGSMVRRGIEMHEEKSLQHSLQVNIVEGSRAMEAQKQRLEAALVEIDAQTGEILLSALELGSGCETRAHCHRVASYAVILAETMGIRGFALASIRLGALLHDIGKIAVPDEILSKPGPLGREEMNQVRRHAKLGAEMLSGYPRLEEVRRLVLQHHERWDGLGYPSQLKGEETALGARILAVADAIEAMLSDRPYRSAYSPEMMAELIVKGAGEQFDRTVVEAFTTVPSARWLEVRKKFPDAPVAMARNRDAA